MEKEWKCLSFYDEWLKYCIKDTQLQFIFQSIAIKLTQKIMIIINDILTFLILYIISKCLNIKKIEVLLNDKSLDKITWVLQPFSLILPDKLQFYKDYEDC